MARRRRALAAVLVGAGALAALLVARYLTFDAAAWADDAADRMSLFSASTLGALGTIARASNPEGVVGALGSVRTEELGARQERFAAQMRALRTRFHTAPGPCVRYGADEAPAPARIEEAADAIVRAGLAREVSALVVDSLRWRMEEDDRLHAADEATEVLAYFSEQAPAWQRVGIWMHRTAARDALRARLTRSQALAAKHVREGSLAQAREVSARYGPLVTLAAFRVSKELRDTDLLASRIAFVSPGMTAGEIETRLGPPDDRQGDTWTWKDPPIEIFFDEHHEAGAVARALQKDAFREPLSAGAKTLVRRDEPSLVEALGPPAWSHDDGNGNREVVWEAGDLRRRAVFEAGTLAHVELWKQGLLTKQ